MSSRQLLALIWLMVFMLLGSEFWAEYQEPERAIEKDFKASGIDIEAVVELAGVVYSETASLRPQWLNKQGPKKVTNYDPESAGQLFEARKTIAEVTMNLVAIGRGSYVAKPRPPSESEQKNPHVKRVWSLCMQVAWEVLEERQLFVLESALQYRTRRGRLNWLGLPEKQDRYIRGLAPRNYYGPFRNLDAKSPTGKTDWAFIDIYERDVAGGPKPKRK
jgi:hypothetical protein